MELNRVVMLSIKYYFFKKNQSQTKWVMPQHEYIKLKWVRPKQINHLQNETLIREVWSSI